MKPKIICLCGSTKFADTHAVKRWEFERTGQMICLMINFLPAWYLKQEGFTKPHHVGEQSGDKIILDELHLRKIDLSDEIFVINVGGYIGESTYNEICYAKSLGKPVIYLTPLTPGLYKCKQDFEKPASMLKHKKGYVLNVIEIHDTHAVCQMLKPKELVQFHMSTEDIFKNYEKVNS